MNQPATGDFVELVEAYERLTDDMRKLAPEQRRGAAARLQEVAAAMLEGFEGERLEKLALWYVDHFYGLLHRLSMLDQASFAVANALGSRLVARMLRQGTSVAYLVDNQIAQDRLVAARPLYSAMGFVVVSPELLAIELARADGGGDADDLDDLVDRYGTEATGLASRLYDETVSKGLPLVWLSGSTDLELYRQLGRRLAGSRYVGAFRNQAPEDGSTVQVFRGSWLGADVDIDPQY